ncbi:hypothetical protein QCQ60_004982 [Bacillus cereus]|nr:hypothetical protein [Bacillus cereus]
MKKDNIWTLLNDPKVQETGGPSQEPDDIFAGMEELSEITYDELPF